MSNPPLTGSSNTVRVRCPVSVAKPDNGKIGLTHSLWQSLEISKISLPYGWGVKNVKIFKNNLVLYFFV